MAGVEAKDLCLKLKKDSKGNTCSFSIFNSAGDRCRIMTTLQT